MNKTLKLDSAFSPDDSVKAEFSLFEDEKMYR